MAIRADDVDLNRDRGLVEQFQAGDAAAFDDLYQRYFARLYRFCLKRVGDSYEAEELAQEAFARAFLNLPRLAGDRKFYPWVTVIASRLCADTHRRRARTEPRDDVDPGLVDGGQEAVLALVDVALLQTALARITPRHREVLELREAEGYSYQRIAEHFDVSLGTVEALLWRARRALRREFLSLNGDDVPVVVPLAGLGTLGAWRARLAAWRARTVALRVLSQQPITAAAAAAVVAVAVGTLTVTWPAPSPPAPAATPRTSLSALADTQGVAPAATVALPATSPAHEAARLASRPGGFRPVASPAAGGMTVLARTQVTGAAPARQQAEQMPVHASIAGVAVGITPTRIIPAVGVPPVLPAKGIS